MVASTKDMHEETLSLDVSFEHDNPSCLTFCNIQAYFTRLVHYILSRLKPRHYSLLQLSAQYEIDSFPVDAENISNVVRFFMKSINVLDVGYEENR